MGRITASTELVTALIAAQFPRWASLPVRPVQAQGFDNTTFRLGETLTVRMPAAAPCALQVPKEHRWLPQLAPHLPVRVPVPVAMGEPGAGYPWNWSVCEWLDGTPAISASSADRCRLARELAEFLVALHKIDVTRGPLPGEHNFFRGAPLATLRDETSEALAVLKDRIDVARARTLWDRALASTWVGPPQWVHGDLSPENFLCSQGGLSGVIDFGGLAVGDPACDLAIAWTFFSGSSRKEFIAHLPVEDEIWLRARGWALWKSLIGLARRPDDRHLEVLIADVSRP